jgi:uncharacterized protein (DUF3820 family)
MIMPFGKYQGYSLEDMYEEDPEYCEWLLEQDWLFADLRAELEALVE